MCDYRERLSANANDFDSIVDEMLGSYEALREYVDSGKSDNELVIEQQAIIYEV
jgi:hypothetical protein